MMPITERPAVTLGACAMAALVATMSPEQSSAQSLRGSRASVERMYRQAQVEDFSFFPTPARVRKAVSAKLLVPLRPDSALTLHQVGFPYVRPATQLFVQRLGDQYYAACGERLVVTSAVRPATRQPANSTAKSVHPTGMAIDLRRPVRRTCLTWLRKTLVTLEKAGVIEATEERSPAHFHVAVFATPYEKYVAARTTSERPVRRAVAVAKKSATPAKAMGVATYTVRSGDTLWEIARQYDVSVDAITNANALADETIRPGQSLVIPSGG